MWLGFLLWFGGLVCVSDCLLFADLFVALILFSLSGFSGACIVFALDFVRVFCCGCMFVGIVWLLMISCGVVVVVCC